MGRTKKMSLPVRKRIRETLETGKLTKHGYSMHKNATSRHRALGKAVREDGPLSVYQSLLILRLWNREQNPKLAEIAEDDATWVGKRYGVEADGYSFR